MWRKKWNRKRVAGWLGAIVLSIWIPVAVDQAYFRYNAYVLPVIGFLAALAYVGLIVTTPKVSRYLTYLHAEFATKPIEYMIIMGSIVGVIMLVLGMCEWWAIASSRVHVADLLKRDAPLQTAMDRPEPKPQVIAKTAPIKPTRPNNGSMRSTHLSLDHRKSRGPQNGSDHAQENPAVDAPTGVSSRSGTAVEGSVNVQSGTVASFGQQGDITAGASAPYGIANGPGAKVFGQQTVINGSVPVKIGIRELIRNSPFDGGGYISRWALEMDGTVPMLGVNVLGESIVDVNLVPERNTGIPFVRSFDLPGGKGQTLSNFYGTVDLVVRHSLSSKFRILFACDPPKSCNLDGSGRAW